MVKVNQPIIPATMEIWKTAVVYEPKYNDDRPALSIAISRRLEAYVIITNTEMPMHVCVQPFPVV
jgi:hypothetical protein